MHGLFLSHILYTFQPLHLVVLYKFFFSLFPHVMGTNDHSANTQNTLNLIPRILSISKVFLLLTKILEQLFYVKMTYCSVTY
jgi:hypothetical protein